MIAVGASSSSSSTTGDGPRERCDALLRSRRVALGAGSSSFSSVSTARSPAVSAVVTAIEIRFDGAPPLIDPPVIFEMLYVENRLDARRSSASLCFSAAKELCTAGASGGGESRNAGGGGSGGES